MRFVTVNNAVNANLFLNSNGSVSLANPSVVFICVLINIVVFFLVHTVNRVVCHSPDRRAFVGFVAHCLNGK